MALEGIRKSMIDIRYISLLRCVCKFTDHETLSIRFDVYRRTDDRRWSMVRGAGGSSPQLSACVNCGNQGLFPPPSHGAWERGYYRPTHFSNQFSRSVSSGTPPILPSMGILIIVLQL